MIIYLIVGLTLLIIAVVIALAAYQQMGADHEGR